MSEIGFLTIGRLWLEYRRVFGESEANGAPTLVLLHEGLGCVGLWKDFPERLAQATGLSVFLWSRAGFGRSDPIALPRPLDYLDKETHLIPEVLSAAGIGKAVLIGHSDGGTLALLHAASGRAHDTLAIVTMAAHVFVEDVTIDGILATKRTWEEGDLRAKLARWHGENVDVAFHGWCDTWLDPEFRDWNIVPRLPAIHIPVLVMQGADDEYGTAAQVKAIVHHVSGPVESMLLPVAGHSPHIDQPDVVIAAISRFVRECVEGGRVAAAR